MMAVLMTTRFCLQLSLDLHYTEDEIYELSLAREPRNSLSSVSVHHTQFSLNTVSNRLVKELKIFNNIEISELSSAHIWN